MDDRLKVLKALAEGGDLFSHQVTTRVHGIPAPRVIYLLHYLNEDGLITFQMRKIGINKWGRCFRVTEQGRDLLNSEGIEIVRDPLDGPAIEEYKRGDTPEARALLNKAMRESVQDG